MKCYLGLTCNVGSYARVVQELIGLNIPKEDLTELLYSPLDILIQFTELESLDAFVEKWFNPIVQMNAEEALITETLTFIVISAGPSLTEVPFAYLFLNTPPQYFATIQDSLLTTTGVLSADTVFGPYDVICPVQASDRTDLDLLIARIQRSIPSLKVSMMAVVKLRS